MENLRHLNTMAVFAYKNAYDSRSPQEVVLDSSEEDVVFYKAEAQKWKDECQRLQ